VGGVPIKPEYGPTLGRLLSPRWQAARPLTRALALAACAGAVALVIGAVLTLENAHYSQDGAVPFGFSYRSLYRTRPDAGGYVKVVRRRADGSVEALAVGEFLCSSFLLTLKFEPSAEFVDDFLGRGPDVDSDGVGRLLEVSKLARQNMFVSKMAFARQQALVNQIVGTFQIDKANV